MDHAVKAITDSITCVHYSNNCEPWKYQNILINVKAKGPFWPPDIFVNISQMTEIFIQMQWRRQSQKVGAQTIFLRW